MIIFKCKPKIQWVSELKDYKLCVSIPENIGKSHYVNGSSKKLDSWSNSNMFTGFIFRALSDAGIKKHIPIDNLPAIVSLDKSGFLTVVKIDI